MTFSEFINHLAPEQVNTWWNDIAPNTAPEKAEDENWKYQLSKNGKSLPFKWTIKELATYYIINFNLKDFSSTDLTRNSFCDVFDFDIVEELVYNRTESNSFVDFYNSLQKTQALFHESLDYLNKIVLSNQINPYKIRMATRDSNRQAMVIIGMRAVFAIREENNKIKLALILDKTIYENNRSNLNVKYEEQFKGKPENKVLVSIEINKWNDIPKEILENNTDEILVQYDNIKDSKRSSWNTEANTTNSVLKYLIFKGENAEEWVNSNKIVTSILNFKQAVEQYRIHLSNNSKLNARFKIMECQKHFVFIYDILNGFTNLECHYELITRDKVNIAIEIHFEQSNKKEYLQQLKSELPEKVKIEEKHKKDGLSIAYETNYAITDRDLFDKIDKALIYLNENLGDRILKIKTHMGKVDVKEAFIEWFIENDGKNTNYFSQQFSSNADRLRSEINEYEEIYKNDFNTELFVIENKDHKRQIEVIKSNIYNKSGSFAKYSKDKSNDRPRAILGKKNYIKFLNQYFENSQNSEDNVTKNNNVKMDLNRILYGPPGTGKTFTLQKEYFDMFTVKETSLTREQFLESKVAELTWWQVVSIAVRDLGSSKVNDIYNHEFVRMKDKLSSSKTVRPTIWGQLQAHTVLNCEHVNVSKRSEPLFFNKDANSEWSIDPEMLSQYFPEANELLEASKNYNPQNDREIRNYEFVTFHQSFSYEDFIEGIKPMLEDGESDLGYEIKDGIFKKLSLKAEADPNSNFAIFIDEINRGNISSIFGELITLIESDKRIGQENELRVKLPYSKTEFGVPSNLYIIGTMNTADRSVEALDSALRRRFSFTEIMPEPELLEEISFNDFTLDEVLETINHRIEILLDRDHTIGHSYFLKVNSNNTEELTAVFQNCIIPLLQEYFYHDYEKIALILGQGFVQVKDNKNIQFAFVDGLGQPEITKQFELINHIEDIEKAIVLLLNKND
ncbi:hypothetical protein B0A67_06140 [Flavobacterium aquidurense]|uniref:McrB family protein n=1 Tax=Flavobacterium aquidurense TaxID=362413 RepID=UPI000915105A|nr:AAA family ATPase [Flavobacterium aquidurense]OXA73020.1 hypothetical protein B0A67_06140 [Flavobacterium aquidurense]SHH17095.1 AAA domain (dynein-related subfamily) [Flavobacterium frigidimaris]